ncbi:MAG: hypothetical protein U0T83_08285 [Bacteriovoracaceae bacterium]
MASICDLTATALARFKSTTASRTSVLVRVPACNPARASRTASSAFLMELNLAL